MTGRGFTCTRKRNKAVPDEKTLNHSMSSVCKKSGWFFFRSLGMSGGGGSSGTGPHFSADWRGAETGAAARFQSKRSDGRGGRPLLLLRFHSLFFRRQMNLPGVVVVVIHLAVATPFDRHFEDTLGFFGRQA